MMTGLLARLLWQGKVHSGGSSKKYLNPEKGPQSLQYTLTANLDVIPTEAWPLVMILLNRSGHQALLACVY